MIWNPFSRKLRLNLDDRTFGAISMTSEGCWENRAFHFAGYEGVQLLVGGDENGPAQAQRHFFDDLLARYAELEPRIRQALSAYREDRPPQERFRLTAIYIPSFQDQESRTWRLWYDLEGDEDFTYGVEMSDWDRIVPFAED
jgi:hypothetical protein